MKNVSQDTCDRNVDFMEAEITNVIKSFGTRAPGSKGERDANQYFANMLKEYSDDVKVEEFEVREASFMGWLYITICGIILSVVLMWFSLNIASFLIITACLSLVVLHLVFYKQVLKYFYKKQTSTNVYAVKKPTGEVKRRIIFSGHTDAAYEWGLLNLGGFPLFITCVIGGIGSAFAVLILSLVGLAVNGFSVAVPGGWFRILLIILTIVAIPFALSLLYFSDRRKIVDGANDNLSACLMAISVLKTMKDEGIEFENTEVGVICAGSEEAGLRGSMAFAKMHKGEFDDVETAFICLETLREPECLSVYSKDLNGTVKATPEVCRLLQKAGKESLGVELPSITVTLGATDAAGFVKGGLKSACLAAIDHNLKPYYHTRKDTYDNLSKECLDKSYKVVMKTLEIFDREGMK